MCARLSDTTVYGNLIVTGTITGTVASTVSVMSADDDKYIPYGLLRVTEADGEQHTVTAFAGQPTDGVVYEVAGRLRTDDELAYPVIIEKLS